MRLVRLILVSMLCGALLIAPVAAQTRPFEGVTLTLITHPTLYASFGGPEGHIAEFERLTGATVNVDISPTQEIQEKIYIDFATRSGRYDVISVEGAMPNAQLFPFLAPLDNYIARAAAEWDFDDFVASLMPPVTYRDQTYGIPFRFGSTMLYYRTDLMEEAGLNAPKTWDDYMEAAEKLTKDGVYGTVARGKADEIVHDYLQIFYGFGGDLLTDDWSAPLLDTEKAIAAARVQAEVFQKGYVSPESLAWGRDDIIAAMQSGRAAMGIYYAPYWGRLTNREESPYADKIGWALLPSADGVTQGRTRNGGWYLSINRFSQNQEAAWALIEWLTNKENSLEQAVKWDQGPTRSSVYHSPEYLSLFPLAGDWERALAASIIDPPHPRFGRFVDVLSEELANIMRGLKTPEEGMKSAHQRIQGML